MPVPPDAAFYVLLEATYARFRLTKVYDSSQTCEFSSTLGAFARGGNFVAQVVPSAEGTTIRVRGLGRIACPRMQAHKAKVMNQLLDDVVERLRSLWQG